MLPFSVDVLARVVRVRRQRARRRRAREQQVLGERRHEDAVVRRAEHRTAVVEVISDADPRADRRLGDEQRVAIEADAEADVEIRQRRQRVLREETDGLSGGAAVEGEGADLASGHREVLDDRIAVVLHARLEAMPALREADRRVHALMIERAILRGRDRHGRQRVELRARRPPVADHVERRRVAELPQPGDRLRVVGQGLRRIDAGRLRVRTIRRVERAPVHRHDGADEIVVGRPQLELPGEPLGVAAVVEVVGGRRIEIAIGPVAAAAQKISDPRRDPSADRRAAVDCAEAAGVQAGVAEDRARLVEP